MSTKLATIVADFTTQLSASVAIGATTATLQSATDDDSVALPNGVYHFAIDGKNSQKEHIVATLSGTALTNISSISRQGVITSGFARAHRVGASVTLTDFANLRFITDILQGTTMLDSAHPLIYDGTASITTSNHIATKAYVDAVAVAGAPNASTTVKGIIELATQAELDARTTTGGTGALLVTTPDTIRATKYSDPIATTGSANAYVLTPTPAITAYATGQVFWGIANFTNTGACTLNVSGIGAKSIKKINGTADPASGDITNGQVFCVVYDGTNLQLITPPWLPSQTNKAGFRLTTDGSGLSWIPGMSVLVDPTSVTVASSTTETTLHTVSVPGNALGTGNAIKIEIPISAFNVNTPAKTGTFRVKYGGTTLATSVMTNPGATMTGIITCYLYATGATATQKGVLSIAFNELNTTIGTAHNSSADMQSGTSAIDSTAAQTLVVTAQLNENAATTKVVTQGCIMTLISNA